MQAIQNQNNQQVQALEARIQAIKNETNERVKRLEG
jgi:hypothetical protein